MIYLRDSELKVRFILDHHFLEAYLGTSTEEKEESVLHKIIILANKLSEDDILLLFTGARVMKYAEELLAGKVGRYAVKRSLLKFLVNVVPDEDTQNIILSVWKSASKVGYKNYLITPNAELEKRFKEQKCSFDIETPEKAYFTIVNLAKNQNSPIILD